MDKFIIDGILGVEVFIRVEGRVGGRGVFGIMLMWIEFELVGG